MRGTLDRTRGAARSRTAACDSAAAAGGIAAGTPEPACEGGTRLKGLETQPGARHRARDRQGVAGMPWPGRGRDVGRAFVDRWRTSRKGRAFGPDVAPSPSGQGSSDRQGNAGNGLAARANRCRASCPVLDARSRRGPAIGCHLLPRHGLDTHTQARPSPFLPPRKCHVACSNSVASRSRCYGRMGVATCSTPLRGATLATTATAVSAVGIR
jgi:hypothetical protein